MASKAITEKPDQRVGWQSVEETAPSVLAADEPTVARMIGFIGLLLFVLGAVAVGFSLAKSEKWIGGVTGTVFSLFGLCGLLYHVARETDTQIRRVYGVLGGAGLVAAAIFCAVYPFDATAGKLFLPWGIISLAIALMFLLPAVRGETEESWHKRVSCSSASSDWPQPALRSSAAISARISCCRSVHCWGLSVWRICGPSSAFTAPRATWGIGPPLCSDWPAASFSWSPSPEAC